MPILFEKYRVMDYIFDKKKKKMHFFIVRELFLMCMATSQTS